jgi:hypothetical protein
MNVVVRTAGRENFDLCISGDRPKKAPQPFGITDEGQSALGSKDAMNEVDVVGVGHEVSPLRGSDRNGMMTGGLRPRL